ncbi:MAG: DUF2007 domain-containing protein [Eubacteriaceae bacterium]|nr:DUF2007 domain-containing protein [Eubacteriaceae bacterium]
MGNDITKGKWRDGVYLTTAQTGLEADIIESKLRGEGIPCLRKYKGAGNFMEIAIGVNTIQPIEIYVPPETLEDAKEIIVPVPIDDDFDPGDE